MTREEAITIIRLNKDRMNGPVQAALGVLLPELEAKPEEPKDARIRRMILEYTAIAGNGNDWEEVNAWLNDKVPVPERWQTLITWRTCKAGDRFGVRALIRYQAYTEIGFYARADAEWVPMYEIEHPKLTWSQLKAKALELREKAIAEGRTCKTCAYWNGCADSVRLGYCENCEPALQRAAEDTCEYWEPMVKIVEARDKGELYAGLNPPPAIPPMKEQKPAEWSEEDEKMLNNIQYLLHTFIYGSAETGMAEYKYQKEIDWLKGLSKPTIKWSAEDEKIHNGLVRLLDLLFENDNYLTEVGIDAGVLKRWLKSLRPQSRQEISYQTLTAREKELLEGKQVEGPKNCRNCRKEKHCFREDTHWGGPCEDYEREEDGQ